LRILEISFGFSGIKACASSVGHKQKWKRGYEVIRRQARFAKSPLTECHEESYYHRFRDDNCKGKIIFLFVLDNEFELHRFVNDC
jgi:hypothetical protein